MVNFVINRRWKESLVPTKITSTVWILLAPLVKAFGTCDWKREVSKRSLTSFLGHWSLWCHLRHMLNTRAHQHFTDK